MDVLGLVQVSAITKIVLILPSSSLNTSFYHMNNKISNGRVDLRSLEYLFKRGELKNFHQTFAILRHLWPQIVKTFHRGNTK